MTPPFGRTVITDAEGPKEFEVRNGSADILEYVTEYGTADGWTFKKWKSGTYEMFGEFNVTTTEAGTLVGGAIGGVYRSEELTLKTPFAIASAVVYGSASDSFVVTNGGMADENNIAFVLMHHEAIDPGTEVTARIHATGIYNQGGT